MADGVVLGWTNQTPLRTDCEHADGNAMLPVRFVRNGPLVIGAVTLGSVAIWDQSNLMTLQTLHHGSEVLCLAVSPHVYIRVSLIITHKLGCRPNHSRGWVSQSLSSIYHCLARLYQQHSNSAVSMGLRIVPWACQLWYHMVAIYEALGRESSLGLSRSWCTSKT